MNVEKYKIGIIGLGPVGMVLAVQLKKVGCEVAICDFDFDKMNLIRNKGIQLVGKIKEAEFFSYIYTSIKDLLTHDFDILICASKAYHVDDILSQIEKDASNGIYLLCAQNGIDVRIKYTSHFSESQIMRMVVNYAGIMQAPNVVDVTFFNPPNYVASMDDSQEAISKWIADVLTGSNLKTKSADSFTMTKQVWEKTILNAALSPLCGISKMTMKEAMDHPDTLEIVEQIIYEAVAVAKAEEVKLEENFVKLCIRYLKNAGDHFPSLAVDIINNRETEIDYMNGKIVDYGKKHYIRTPLNLTFTNLVRAITEKNVKAKKY